MAQNSDISAADGALITAQALLWKSTPYALVGAGSAVGLGGDCSGTTWRIYTAAGFPYEYNSTEAFPGYVTDKKRFRVVGAGEAMQEGDVLLWASHMAIYSTFTNDTADAVTDRINAKGKHWDQQNDMWSATHPGGAPYGPNKLAYFGNASPAVYRYQK